MNELAIAALTPRGLDLGRRLAQILGRGDVVAADDSTRRVLEELFSTGRPMVCIMALGIVVRILGPLTKDKETESPVVVVDEAGQFAISVLGGHRGGANALAKEVAKAIGAVPVITTASDCLGLPAVDLIGREWGWKIERNDNLTRVAAAVVRGETIGIHQTVGRRDWCKVFGEWPSTFQLLRSWPPVGHWPGLLVISDRLIPATDLWPTVIYRPPSVVLGVGCRRGVPVEEIEVMFQDLCRQHGFSPLSLGLVATAAIKANEPGLLKFAQLHDVALQSYAVEQLAQVSPLPTPSKVVRSKIGIDGVAEPAALLASGASELLVTKQRGPRITMALARRADV